MYILNYVLHKLPRGLRAAGARPDLAADPCQWLHAPPRLHLASNLFYPAQSAAPVAVYTHKSIMVKSRPDLEKNDLQLASLEARLPGRKKWL